jgi:hypothetical protein
MQLSPAARRDHTTGSIVTMMSVDAERIYQVSHNPPAPIILTSSHELPVTKALALTLIRDRRGC